MRKIPKVGDYVYYLKDTKDYTKAGKLIWIQKYHINLILSMIEENNKSIIKNNEKIKEAFDKVEVILLFDNNKEVSTTIKWIETEEERKLRIREEQLIKLLNN